MKINNCVMSLADVVQVIDTMLIPPTAEIGLTVLDRISRTPWLKVICSFLKNFQINNLWRNYLTLLSSQIYEELVLVLGLQPEFRGQGLPPGDVSVFAAIDVAWISFFAKLALSREALFESHTALLYDIILFSTVTERPAGSFATIEQESIRFTLCVFSIMLLSQQHSCRTFKILISSIHLLNRSTSPTSKYIRRQCRDIGKALQISLFIVMIPSQNQAVHLLPR